MTKPSVKQNQTQVTSHCSTITSAPFLLLWVTHPLPFPPPFSPCVLLCRVNGRQHHITLTHVGLYTECLGSFWEGYNMCGSHRTWTEARGQLSYLCMGSEDQTQSPCFTESIFTPGPSCQPFNCLLCFNIKSNWTILHMTSAQKARLCLYWLRGALLRNLRVSELCCESLMAPHIFLPWSQVYPR